MFLVVRQRLKQELHDNTSLVVVVTCRDRTSLHEVLSSTKGLSLFQHVTHIKAPNEVNVSLLQSLSL